MTESHIFLLGILQGATEFLPISSSGHLVLAENWLGLQLHPDSLLGVNVLLHAGTLLALVILYWQRWYSLLLSPFTGDAIHRKLLLLLIVATIPAVVAGVLLGNAITRLFSSTTSVAGSFLATAFVLWFGERYTNQQRVEHLRWCNALFVGIAQACALVPGLSRSGLSISAGRIAGLTREEALDFSFLMAVPILAGAALYTFIEGTAKGFFMPDLHVLLVGFFTSFVASMLAILFLRRFVQRNSLSWFSLYLGLLSVLIFFFEFFS